MSIQVPIPTPIRGKVYPSQTAAAKELGVSQQRISNAAKSGTLDSVGLGPMGIKLPSRMGFSCRVPTFINDRNYPSIAEAARDAEVGRTAVIQAIDRGRRFVGKKYRP